MECLAIHIEKMRRTGSQPTPSRSQARAWDQDPCTQGLNLGTVVVLAGDTRGTGCFTQMNNSPFQGWLGLCYVLRLQHKGMACWPLLALFWCHSTVPSNDSNDCQIVLKNTPAPGEKALENQEWDEPRIKLYVATNGPADLLPPLVYEWTNGGAGATTPHFSLKIPAKTSPKNTVPAYKSSFPTWKSTPL